MSFEEDLKAALTAEAATVRVPGEEMLGQLRRRLRAERAARLLLTCAFAGLVSSAALLRGDTPTVGPAGPGHADLAAAAAPAPARRQVTPEALGVRLTLPTGFSGPGVDEQGRLVYTRKPVVVTIGRRPRQEGKVAADLVGDLVAQTLKEHHRLKPVDVGFAQVDGREAAYMHVRYVSAAAGFDRETYVVPVGKYEYVATCGTEAGAGVDWEQARPVCDQVIKGLKVGMEPRQNQ